MQINLNLETKEATAQDARFLVALASAITGTLYDNETDEATTPANGVTAPRKTGGKKSTTKADTPTQELADAAEPMETEEAEAPKAVTLDDLRKIATPILEMENDEMTEKFMALCKKHGGASLGKVPKAAFDAFLPELQSLAKKAAAL